MTIIMSHTHCISSSLVARATAATFRSTMMGTGFTRFGGGGGQLRVAAELEMEADVNLSVLPVTGVSKPQYRKRLENRPYSILSRAGSYWTAG